VGTGVRSQPPLSLSCTTRCHGSRLRHSREHSGLGFSSPPASATAPRRSGSASPVASPRSTPVQEPAKQPPPRPSTPVSLPVAPSGRLPSRDPFGEDWRSESMELTGNVCSIRLTRKTRVRHGRWQTNEDECVSVLLRQLQDSASYFNVCTRWR
jgi:hypothetical protein